MENCRRAFQLVKPALVYANESGRHRELRVRAVVERSLMEELSSTPDKLRSDLKGAIEEIVSIMDSRPALTSLFVGLTTNLRPVLSGSMAEMASIGVPWQDLVSSPDLISSSEALNSTLEVVEAGALEDSGSLVADDGSVAEDVSDGGHVFGDELPIAVCPDMDEVFAGEQGEVADGVQPSAFSMVSSFQSSLSGMDDFSSSLSGLKYGSVVGGVVSEEGLAVSVAREALRPQPSDGLRQPPWSPVSPMPVRVVGNALGFLPMVVVGSAIGGKAHGRAQQLQFAALLVSGVAA
ncbi:hypothetical protein Dimus_030433, partial [Dionaea muscipula]